MKKILLATTLFALLAPVAHAEIKLDLGGYFKGYAGYADQDAAGSRSIDFKRKAQVFFTGETTLDNGLTVGYNGQLMQDSSVDPSVLDAAGFGGEDAKLEQSYLFFSGNWGRMNIGRENGAAYLLQVAAPGADSNLDGQDIAFSFFNQGAANIRQEYSQTGAANIAGFRGEDFQYADKITYLTPKFNGFQAGLSYTPEVESKDVNDYFVQSSDGDAGGYEHLLDGGIRYDGEFAGFGVHAGAGYTMASLETAAVVGQDDYNEWNAGLKMTYEGFGLGGAYNSRDLGVSPIAVGDQVDTWVVGADYNYGAYDFGISYLSSEGDAGASDDEYSRVTVGAGYTFGPGMKFKGSVGLHDLDAATPGADNDAAVVAIGTDVQF